MIVNEAWEITVRKLCDTELIKSYSTKGNISYNGLISQSYDLSKGYRAGSEVFLFYKNFSRINFLTTNHLKKIDYAT